MSAANSSSSFVAALGSVARFAARLRDMSERRRVLHEIACLDEHMLRDIGLTRFDVNAAFVEPIGVDATVVLAERARDMRRHQRSASSNAQGFLKRVA